MNNKINYDNLNYVVLSSGDEYNFNKLDDPLTFLNNIKKDKISLNEAIAQQRNYYNYLNIIRIGNKNANQKKVFIMQEIVRSNLFKIIVQ